MKTIAFISLALALFTTACGDTYNNNYYQNDVGETSVESDTLDSNVYGEVLEVDQSSHKEDEAIINQTNGLNAHFEQCAQQGWSDLAACQELCPWGESPEGCKEEKEIPCLELADAKEKECYNNTPFLGCVIDLSEGSTHDADSDGLTDIEEVFSYYLNPCEPCSCGQGAACDIANDVDGDGIPYNEDEAPLCSAIMLHCFLLTRPLDACD